MRNVKRLIALVGISALGIVAQAEKTYYLNRSESGSSLNCWMTPGCWSTTVKASQGGTPATGFSDTDDFIIPPQSASFTLRTPDKKSDNWSWTGKTLVVGGDDYQYKNSSFAAVLHSVRGDGASLTYENNGLVLARRSRYMPRYPGLNRVCGRVTVTGDGDYPAALRSRYNDNVTLQFADAVTGNSAACLHVDSSYANFVAVLKDTSSYLGSICVSNYTEGANVGRATQLRLASDLPGCVELTDDTSLAVETAAGISVASLTLKAGSALDLTCGGLAVTGSLTVESTPCTVKVAGIAQEDVTVAQLQDILAFPTSSGCAPKDFVFDGDLGGGELVVREEGGVFKIGLQYYPEARLLVTDETSLTKECPSSMTNSTHWTNVESWTEPAVMPPGFHYVAMKGSGYGSNLRTAYSGTVDDPESDFTFPGESLRIANKSRFVVLNPTFTCKRLVLDSGGEVDASVYVDSSLCGRISIGEGGGTIYHYGDQTHTVAGEIDGRGTLVMQGASGISTSSSYAWFRVSGLNTNFQGAVTVTIPQNIPVPGTKDEYNRITPRFDRNYVHFMISDKRNLGGPLPVVNPKALTLENMSRLELASGCTELTLDEPSRGIFINWVGRFLADEGETMTVASPLAVDGTLWKEGEGMLVLANPAPTFGAEATATEPVGDPTNHLFRIAGGDVKIASVDAVNGLDVVFTNGARRLVVDLAAQTGDFKTYGIRNVKTDSPFALEGDLTGVTLAFESATAPEGVLTGAVFTVKKDRYDDVAAIFSKRTKSAAYRGCRITCTRRDNADGETATMEATVQRTGLMLIFR